MIMFFMSDEIKEQIAQLLGYKTYKEMLEAEEEFRRIEVLKTPEKKKKDITVNSEVKKFTSLCSCQKCNKQYK